MRNAHLGIHLEREHDFGGTVPSCGNVLGHQASFLSAGIGGASASCETKVAHFEITVGIKEKIGWFEVSVYDVRRVHRLESAECLVYEILEAENVNQNTDEVYDSVNLT